MTSASRRTSQRYNRSMSRAIVVNDMVRVPERALQVRPGDLQSQGASHAGSEHVDPPADRHGPGVSDARKLHRGVEFGDQLETKTMLN